MDLENNECSIPNCPAPPLLPENKKNDKIIYGCCKTLNIATN